MDNLYVNVLTNTLYCIVLASGGYAMHAHFYSTLPAISVLITPALGYRQSNYIDCDMRLRAQLRLRCFPSPPAELAYITCPAAFAIRHRSAQCQ